MHQVWVFHRLRAARKKRCSNFLHHFFSPLCLILPTLHICGPTNFPSRFHIGKMGVTRSQRLCYSTPPERDPPFITFTTRRTAVAVECLRFYPGGSAVAVAAVQDGILTWGPRRHSQAFQEDKGKSQLAIWVTWLDGFGPAYFPLVVVSELQRWQQLFIKQKTKGWIHKISQVTMPD